MNPQEIKPIYDPNKSNFFPSITQNTDINAQPQIINTNTNTTIPQPALSQPFPPFQNQVHQQQSQQTSSVFIFFSEKSPKTSPVSA